MFNASVDIKNAKLVDLLFVEYTNDVEGITDINFLAETASFD